MPRFCEICHAEFKYASELADHLKLSSCSNYTTMIKCPYCDRNDFVDEDSLNRHLTYNRKCSRADVEATDNLSILAPDNSINIRNNRIPPGCLDTFGLGSSLSEQPDISSHEGNLVNHVNAFDMHLWHQMQTALVTDETRQMLFTASAARMTKDDMGKVHKEVTILSVIGDKTSHQATHQSDKETLSNLHPNPSSQSGSKFVENPRSEIDLRNRCDGIETEFEVVDDDNTPSEEDDDIEQMIHNGEGENVHSSEEEESSDNETNDGHAEPIEANNNDLSISTKPLYDNHTCHHASPELNSLVDLYTILDKRGVANSVFDEVAKWAWLNSHTFGSQPPMKRRVVVEKVFQHVRGERYMEFMTPRQKVLRLSTGRHVALTCFPLELMICDMLSNSTLMEKENLLFSNYNNPTDECLSPTSEQCYGEVNSGSWWQKATRHECKGPKDVLWPIIMFIDAMKVDNLAGKLKLEPITFTFSRFKRWVRNQENAWRTWGYIEEVKQSLCTPGRRSVYHNT
jgi:Cobalamin biosynthesis protein CobT (nicotinate-mononucleotide:5, 6-dimethylbenzimidazole phosphoribosyltransferase)